jgi:hypothetical protein
MVVEDGCILGAGAYIVGELPVFRRLELPETVATPEESPASEERACEHIRR